VHVVDVIEAVPSQLPEDSTQPVEVGNPFSADEPTQTAFTAGGHTAPGATVSLTSGGPPSMPDGSRTVPMRAMSDAGAATVPPARKATTLSDDAAAQLGIEKTEDEVMPIASSTDSGPVKAT
jgi:hypothetical protein